MIEFGYLNSLENWTKEGNKVLTCFPLKLQSGPLDRTPFLLQQMCVCTVEFKTLVWLFFLCQVYLEVMLKVHNFYFPQELNIIRNVLFVCLWCVLSLDFE
jgi:hypothetical protein